MLLAFLLLLSLSWGSRVIIVVLFVFIIVLVFDLSKLHLLIVIVFGADLTGEVQDGVRDDLKIESVRVTRHHDTHDVMKRYHNVVQRVVDGSPPL